MLRRIAQLTEMVVIILFSLASVGIGVVITTVLGKLSWFRYADPLYFYVFGFISGGTFVYFVYDKGLLGAAKRISFQFFYRLWVVFLKEELETKFWVLSRAVAENVNQHYACNRCKAIIPIGIYYYDTNEIPGGLRSLRTYNRARELERTQELQEYLVLTEDRPMTTKFCVDCAQILAKQGDKMIKTKTKEVSQAPVRLIFLGAFLEFTSKQICRFLHDANGQNINLVFMLDGIDKIYHGGCIMFLLVGTGILIPRYCLYGSIWVNGKG